jgi:aspartate aminotransferase
MKKVFVSDRLLEIPDSPIRKLAPFATAAQKQGITVLKLNIGDPDIKTPQVMLDQLTHWVKNPISYSASQGQPEFLKALEQYYHQLGFSYLKQNNIQITTGGSEAISLALFSICNPDDEVLVFEPFYANYQSFSVQNHVHLVPITTFGHNGFHLPPKKEILSHLTSRTKAILLCNPNNPTGTVFTKTEMDTIFSLAKEFNLFVISDEVYREFVYDGRKHISILEYMPKFPRQSILLDSLSKRYSLCGARLGTLVSLNPDLMTGVLRIARGRLSSGLVDQLMASKLTEVNENYFTAIINEYQTRRDVIFSGLSQIPGVYLTNPEGAFYLVVRLPVHDAEHFCKWLLTDFSYQDTTVMLAPAAGFYLTPDLGKNEVRIAYVINQDDLKKAILIISQALLKYQQLFPL